MWLTFILVGGAIVYTLRFLLNKLYGTIDPSNEINVKGKIVVITGANGGVGYATALEFAKRDAHIVLACRDMSRANQAIQNIRKVTQKGQMVAMKLDLNSLEAVRQFAKEFNSKYEKLDILVNNAAVMLNPEKELKTEDGHEIHFGVNHLGPFLLTRLLLDKLVKAQPSRIVNVSAGAHLFVSWDDVVAISKPSFKPNYEYSLVDKLFLKQIGPGNKPYSASKLANALFSLELAKKLEEKGVTGVKTYALCPGVVDTALADSLDISAPKRFIFQCFEKLVFKTPEQGCWTTLYCALSKNVINETGQMYQNCGFWQEKHRVPLSDENARKLWELSEPLVGVDPY